MIHCILFNITMQVRRVRELKRKQAELEEKRKQLEERRKARDGHVESRQVLAASYVRLLLY